MLMRTDPLRDLDRLAQAALGTPARPAGMLMDAYRRGHLDADYHAGVLTITIPIAERVTSRKVEITAGGSNNEVTT